MADNPLFARLIPHHVMYHAVREERHGHTRRRYYRATARGKAAVEAVTPRVAEPHRELVEHRVPTRRGR
jgi:DNA-binding PadR family transcriptional regulator